MNTQRRSQVEQRLKSDSERLPGCPQEIHDRIMLALAQEPVPVPADQEAEFTLARNAGRPMLAFGLAALLAVVFTSVYIQKQSAVAPIAETVSLNPLPEQPMTQMAGTINTVFESPYQAEMKNLGQDVESATRFLLMRFGESVPTSVPSDDPQG